MCSVASQFVMLILVDTYQSLLHNHSSQFFFQTTCFNPMWPSSGSSTCSKSLHWVNYMHQNFPMLSKLMIKIKVKLNKMFLKSYNRQKLSAQLGESRWVLSCAVFDNMTWQWQLTCFLLSSQWLAPWWFFMRQ
jgi:hypothetical protein